MESCHDSATGPRCNWTSSSSSLPVPRHHLTAGTNSDQMLNSDEDAGTKTSNTDQNGDGSTPFLFSRKRQSKIRSEMLITGMTLDDLDQCQGKSENLTCF